MHKLTIFSLLLITTATSFGAASEATTTAPVAWTSNPVLLQTVASVKGADGCKIFSYGTQEPATESFGFALLPATMTVPFEINKDTTFADIISNPGVMYFYIEHNTKLITENTATTVTAYGHSLAKRFMLLCAHKARRDHIQHELEYNGHILKNIEDVKSFLQTRLGDSSFVVADFDTYGQHMFAQTVDSNKLRSIVSSPAEPVATVRVAEGRSMSF